MNTRLFSVTTLMLATTVVAACQTASQGSGDAALGICRPDAAQSLQGLSRMTDDEARQRTGATIVRQIAPGQGVTADYRQERVTIEIDPKTEKIVRAVCG